MYSRSTSRRELSPALASLVLAGLRIGLHTENGKRPKKRYASQQKDAQMFQDWDNRSLAIAPYRSEIVEAGQTDDSSVGPPLSSTSQRRTHDA